MVKSVDRGAKRATVGSRPLHPDDFSFYGFGELRRDELRKIMRLGIRTDEPKVSAIEGAIFVPNFRESRPGQTKFAAGLMAADGQPIEMAQMHRKGGKRVGGLTEPVAVVPEGHVDEEVIYLGMLFNHYGRVLLESLARLWHLKNVDPGVKVVFNNANAAQVAHAPWLPRVLNVFGISPERIVSPDRPTQFRRVIVPEPLFEQFYSAHPAMLGPFRNVAQRIAGDVTPSEQPVYLSRSRLSSRQRPIIGEHQLEQLLRDNGFLIIYPETMLIEDQVRMVNAHTEIFSSLGSAAHNILFSIQRPNLHLLANRDDVPANYFLCSALANAPTTFVNCLGWGGRVFPRDERPSRRDQFLEDGERRTSDHDAGQQAIPQLLDMEAIIEYLRERGYLKQRPAASPNGVDSSLRERYDEAWVYARVRKASTKPESMPPQLEAEAEQLARHSWPICLMLGRAYFRARDGAKTEAIVRQFIKLVEAETDSDRLNFYRGDVESIAPKIARLCDSETTKLLSTVMLERFRIDMNGKVAASGARDSRSR